MSDSGGSPSVVILAGPNGAGKSTLAPFLLRDELAVGHYVNADVIAAGLAPFEPDEAAIAAGRIAIARLRELAEARVSFAFETTLAGRSYARFLSELRHQGYQVYLLFIWLRGPEAAVRRVQARVSRGGHSVPEDTIRRRYVMGLRNFHRLYQPLCDQWWMYGNVEASYPRLVAQGGSGSVEVADPEAWRASREDTDE